MLGMRYSYNSWAERYAKTVSNADARILNADKKAYQVDTSKLMVPYFQRASEGRASEGIVTVENKHRYH